MITLTPAAIRKSALTSASLCDSLAENRSGLRVGPMRRQGAYHGRLVTFPTHAEMSADDAMRLTQHAARILSNCDGYDVTVIDGATLAVIARKPE